MAQVKYHSDVRPTFRGDTLLKLQSSFFTLCLLSVAAGSFAADPNLARNLAATCANCHGTNGIAQKGAGIDSLAGLDKARALQKLAEFRNGDKPASIMHQIVRGYTEEQLDLITTYFATQK
jgi:cytochrome subunit of sulfide dehydrogenase